MPTKREMEERIAELEDELEAIQSRISVLLGTKDDREEDGHGETAED